MDDSGDSTDPITAQRLGSVDSAGSFRDDVLAIGVERLSAGGSTSITAVILDQNDAPFTQSVEISFSSPCITQGRASIDTPVQTENGRASATYVAEGCATTDTIVATADVGERSLRATGQLEVAGSEAGSIRFVSAEPQTLALRGTGGSGRSETARVVFRVLNQVGGSVSNAEVGFELNTQTGGLVVDPSSATTDTNGTVQTVVRAGDVSTPVRVTATLIGENIATQSDQLTVSSGLPDNESTSLSVETMNPEANNFDNVAVGVTILLADHFNNPVPDGTTVNFTTEGGQIDSSCTTENGQCRVEWRSADPTPADGRSSILAYAIGEETFEDQNGDARVDSGEWNDLLAQEPDTPFGARTYDLAEAWLDDDEDLAYQSGEPFFDFNDDGGFNGPDNLFNGILCAEAGGSHCSDQESMHVRDRAIIVMSGSEAVFSDPTIASEGSGSDAPDRVAARKASASYDTGCQGSVDLSGSSQAFPVYISDVNVQPMPAGTTVEASTTHGELDFESFTWPSTSENGGREFSFPLAPDGEAGSGTLRINVTTPREVVTTCTIPVTES